MCLQFGSRRPAAAVFAVAGNLGLISQFEFGAQNAGAVAGVAEQASGECGLLGGDIVVAEVVGLDGAGQSVGRLSKMWRCTVSQKTSITMGVGESVCRVSRI